MNTQRSEKKIIELKGKVRYLRKCMTHSHTFQTSADKLFPLLCPTTEYDWLDGWNCELIYSKSLYQEYNLIFKTDFFKFEEVWVISRFEPNRAIEFTRFSQNLSVKADISVSDNLDGASTGHWTINATALTEAGNIILRNLTSETEQMELLIDALDHYIKHDRIKPLPEDLFNKRY